MKSNRLFRFITHAEKGLYCRDSQQTAVTADAQVIAELPEFHPGDTNNDKSRAEANPHIFS